MIDLPLLTLDPGKHIGWALAMGGQLHSFGTLHNIRWNDPFVVDYVVDNIPRACLLVTEMPRVYPDSRKWKGDPQHIVRLAFLAGRIAERFPLWAAVTPKTWQGGSPPEHVLRKVTLSRLKKRERRMVQKARINAHTWDALGLMVFSLNRPMQTA